VIDFALVAEKTVLIASPNDLISAYGSVRACFSRFVGLEIRLCKKIEGYKARRFFRPLILMNNATDFSTAETAFEALVSAVDNRLHSSAGPFRVKMDYLGAVLHDHGLFKKSEKRRCPVSKASIYSKVAFCIDSIAGAINVPVPFNGFDKEKRLRYTIQLLIEQQERLRKAVTQKVIKIDSVKTPFHHGTEFDSEKPLRSTRRSLCKSHW
jgi:hypothetical protein